MADDVALCRGCGRRIIWSRNVESGNLIPLDATAPVYRIKQTSNDGTVDVERDRGVYVSHFSTCSKVDRFKKPKGGTSVPRSDGSGPNGAGEQENP